MKSIQNLITWTSPIDIQLPLSKSTLQSTTTPSNITLLQYIQSNDIPPLHIVDNNIHINNIMNVNNNTTNSSNNIVMDNNNILNIQEDYKEKLHVSNLIYINHIIYTYIYYIYIYILIRVQSVLGIF